MAENTVLEDDVGKTRETTDEKTDDVVSNRTGGGKFPTTGPVAKDRANVGKRVPTMGKRVPTMGKNVPVTGTDKEPVRK